jgi:hypothetical protein
LYLSLGDPSALMQFLAFTLNLGCLPPSGLALLFLESQLLQLESNALLL